nr:HD domain-containing phosphohydrolase [uncultured Acetobacterium sp.]
MPNIMVIDDEKSIRVTLSEFLKKEGYHVITVENVQMAKQLLQEDDVDVVLSDIIMPKESGMTLLKYLHETSPNIRIIMMTGEPTVDTAVDAIRLGAHDYLTKPVYRNELIKAVTNAVNFKQLIDEKHRLELQNQEQRENLEQLVEERTHKLHQAMMNTAYATAAMLDLRDPYTAGHEKRVGSLARAIGKELNLPADTLEGLHIAGCIHDIGKIAIPFEILTKPIQLSLNEYAIIKEHPKIGYDVLTSYEMPWPIAEIVYHHHERLDGSGYPQGLKADQIRLETRIISVSDVVEAMSSHRPYRPSLGLQCAMDEITMNKNKLYDPFVVDACITLFNKKNYTFGE